MSTPDVNLGLGPRPCGTTAPPSAIHACSHTPTVGDDRTRGYLRTPQRRDLNSSYLLHKGEVMLLRVLPVCFLSIGLRCFLDRNTILRSRYLPFSSPVPVSVLPLPIRIFRKWQRVFYYLHSRYREDIRRLHLRVFASTQPTLEQVFCSMI